MTPHPLLPVALIVVALGVVGWIVLRLVTDRPSTNPKLTVAQTPPPTSVGWDTLTAYDYEPGMRDLPASIRSLDGKRVEMDGYLAPTYEFDDIHEFILMRGQGTEPSAPITAQVKVRITATKGIDLVVNRLRVVGRFMAKETLVQGCVLSIFEIEDAAVEVL